MKNLPDDLVWFVDHAVKSLYGIGPKRPGIDPADHVEHSDALPELLSYLEQHPDTAQNNLIELLVSWFRDYRPAAPPEELIRFMFHCGAFVVADHEEHITQWKRTKHRRDRQTVTDEQIQDVLQNVAGNKTQAAKALGISLRQLHNRLKKISKK